MRAVWVFSPDNWWIAGAGGIVLHYDGTALRLEPPPTAPPFVDYWSFWGSPDGGLALSATRDPTVQNSPNLFQLIDGGWQQLIPSGRDSPQLTGDDAHNQLWMLTEEALYWGPPGGVFGENDVFPPGTPVSASGATTSGFFTVLDKAGGGPPFLYFVDAGSAVALDGIDVPDASGLFAVLQTREGQLWVGGVGYGGPESTYAAQWVDGGWQKVIVEGDSSQVESLAELDDGRVLLVCATGRVVSVTPASGKQVTERPGASYDPGLIGVSTSGGFAVAAGVGEIALRNPTNGSWSTVVGSDYRELDRAAASAGTVAAIGYAQLIAVRDGGVWSTLPPIDPNDDNHIHGVAVRQGTVLVSAEQGVYRFNDSTQGWLGLGCKGADAGGYGDMAAAGDDLWIATPAGAIFRDSPDSGCTLEIQTGSGLSAIAAASPSRVWAVGVLGAAWSRDLPDGGWTNHSTGIAGFNDVALSSTDAYAVDTQGAVHSLEALQGAAIGSFGQNADCTNAIAVDGTDAGDVVYVGGSPDVTSTTLCIDGPGGNNTVGVPTDQGLNAMRIDGRKLFMFGNSFSVLSYPLQ
jgi:hypothetical protein